MVAIGANFVGDGLRDFLDPKMRRSNNVLKEDDPRPSRDVSDAA